jgi:hypothetical protein
MIQEKWLIINHVIMYLIKTFEVSMTRKLGGISDEIKNGDSFTSMRFLNRMLLYRLHTLWWL